jgi:hypothetical protein
MKGYRNYKKNYKGIGFIMLPRMVSGLSFTFSRLNILSGWWDGPYFAMSAGLAFFTLPMFAIFMMSTTLVSYVNSKDPEKKDTNLQGWRTFIVNNLLNGAMEESIAVVRVMCVGLSLYARVVAGACPENASFLALAQCNPMAASNGLPSDHVLFLAFLPITIPLAMKGLRLEVIIFIWFLCMGWILASIWHVGGQLEIVTAFLMIMPLSVVFEIERLLRLSFLNLELSEERTKAMLLV